MNAQPRVNARDESGTDISVANVSHFLSVWQRANPLVTSMHMSSLAFGLRDLRGVWMRRMKVRDHYLGDTLPGLSPASQQCAAAAVARSAQASHNIPSMRHWHIPVVSVADMAEIGTCGSQGRFRTYHSA